MQTIKIYFIIKLVVCIHTSHDESCCCLRVNMISKLEQEINFVTYMYAYVNCYISFFPLKTVGCLSGVVWLDSASNFDERF